MKGKIYIVILLLLGLLGIKSLFHSGFYTSHDGRHQIIRLKHFHQGLLDGQLPVRWAGNALAGFGYPLFVFTYRLPFWLAEGWYLVSGNLGGAIKFVFIITYLASGLSMYWFSKKLWSSKLAGFLSGFLYLWAPYRFLNIFVRAALGEAVTFVFIPLVFLGLLNLRKNSKKKFFWLNLTAFSLAGVILSHAITLFLWLIPLISWFGFNLVKTKERIKYLISSFLSGLISLLLTTYYWLPAALERKNTIVADVFGGLGGYYQAHFVTLKQLLYSKWGYGFSMPGVKDDMMSFQVGIAQWLVVLTSLLLLFFTFTKFNKKIIKVVYSKIIFFLLTFFFSIYLMLANSNWLYVYINRFLMVDIPWRFLGVAVFCASILFGSLAVGLKNNFFKWGLIGFIFVLAFYGNRNHLKVNQYTYFPDSEYWQSEETSSEHNDYAPRGFNYTNNEKMKDQLNPESGESHNNLLERKSNFFKFKSQVESEKAEIITKLAYYPGWQLFIDGKKTEISYQDDGRIKIKLTQGDHLVELIFKETKLRLVSNLVSFLTLIVFISLGIKKYARIKR